MPPIERPFRYDCGSIQVVIRFLAFNGGIEQLSGVVIYRNESGIVEDVGETLHQARITHASDERIGSTEQLLVFIHQLEYACPRSRRILKLLMPDGGRLVVDVGVFALAAFFVISL